MPDGRLAARGQDEAHVSAYRRDGFAVVRGVFAPSEVAELAQAFDRRRAEGLRLGRSWRHGNLCYRVAEDPKVGRVVAMLQWGAYADPVLAAYRNHPRMLPIIAPLVGRDVKQIINQCHWKPQGAVAVDYNFHQDIRFRRPRSAFRNIARSYVQTGIAVDPHAAANGAMRILPGSHRLGEIAALGDGVVLGRGRGDAVLRAAGIDPAGLVALGLEPGDVALWHPFTVHGSGPNDDAGGQGGERRFYLNSYVRAADCDRGEWAFRGGRPVALGEPVLVHYEELYTRPEPHYVEGGSPPPD